MLQLMEPPADIRARHQAFLKRVIEETKTPATTLAPRVGVSPSTFSRLLSAKHNNALRASTVEALERFSGISFGADARASRPTGLRESEAAPYDAGQAPANIAERMRIITAAAPHVVAWTLRTRALETIGFLPGDVMMVDLNEVPQPGDVVCAQVYDYSRMRGETIFRLYEPPYLVAASHDRGLMSPRLIDSDVGLKGPVIMSIRGRGTL